MTEARHSFDSVPRKESCGICGALEGEHMDHEKALRVQLAAAEADLRAANARAEKAEAERDRLETAARAYIEGHELALTREEAVAEALAAARREIATAYPALKMVDDAFWGDFCPCCGVILSLESQDEECGPQHTAVQLVHEWVEQNEARTAIAAPGDGEEKKR
jgi:hypothetical protein